MKRLFDLISAIILIVVLLIPLLLIVIMIRISSRGSVLYWSERIGVDNSLFLMPKLRSMKINTPEIASHLFSNPDQYLSPIGGFLRRYSLDEIPQLYSILKGDMSFVGPRPALYNQEDLIELRIQNNTMHLIPGLTGWAQVNGRDELSIIEKVKFEVEYMQNQSFAFDIKILWMTFIRVIRKHGVSH